MSKPESFYRWRPHPWHGLEVGPEPPRIVNAYIEITPFDTIKYQVDRQSGYLRAHRTQEMSSLPPSLYGIIPRTYSGPRVGRLSAKGRCGDGDPIDICVISERQIDHSEVLLMARVVGAIAMVDKDAADDKIIAVLEQDPLWGQTRDVGDLPKIFIERLQHYFATARKNPKVDVRKVVGHARAEEIIEAAIKDYNDAFGGQC